MVVADGWIRDYDYVTKDKNDARDVKMRRSRAHSSSRTIKEPTKTIGHIDAVPTNVVVVERRDAHGGAGDEGVANADGMDDETGGAGANGDAL